MRLDRTFTTTLLLLGVLALGAGGCIFSPDDDGEGDPPPSPYKWPDTTVKLMANFKAAYGDMDIDGYRDVLHQDFKFIFIDGQGPSDFLTREEDLESTQNMFSGEPHTNSEDEYTNGIQNIDVNLLDIIGRWDEISASHEYFGEYAEVGAKALYDVSFVLSHADGTITVTTQQLFFAVPRQASDNGTMRERWELIGQQDLPSK